MFCKLQPVLLGLMLAACSPTATRVDGSPVGDVATIAAADARLEAVVEAFFDATLEMDPLMASYAGHPEYNDRLANYLSPAHRSKSHARDAQYLARVEAIDPAALSAQGRVTRDVFLYDRRMALEAQGFPAHLLPLTQFFSIQNAIPSMGTGRGGQPFATVEDDVIVADRGHAGREPHLHAPATERIEGVVSAAGAERRQQ